MILGTSLLDMFYQNASFQPMENDLLLRKKFTFRVGGQKLVLVKKAVESQRHVVMKALLWALYLPEYPELQVEMAIDNKYKPDLVQTESGSPLFWGEAGSIGTEKLRRILKRFPRCHFACAVWAADITQLETRVRRVTKNVKRCAPVDVLRFPESADREFIDDNGKISIRQSDLDWRRIL